MKTLFLIASLTITVVVPANSDEKPSACPSTYDPVCGIKHVKKNYSNKCLAETDGATNITKGFCERGHRKHKK